MVRLSPRVLGCLSFAVVVVVPVSCHSPGGGGDSPYNNNNNNQPPADHAVIQSFTFQLSEKNEAPWIEPSKPGGSYYQQPSEPDLHVGRCDTHQKLTPPQPMRDGSPNNNNNHGKGHYAVVSTESVYSGVTEDREWEAYREAFLASWRQFMFDEKDHDDDSDSDDDANDGDGSCSILSNDSVYRSPKNAEARARLVAIRYQQRDGTCIKQHEPIEELSKNRRRKSHGRNRTPPTANAMGDSLKIFTGGSEGSASTTTFRVRVEHPARTSSVGGGRFSTIRKRWV